MGNIVEIKELVKDVLNSNAEDPYDPTSTRPGGLPQQFFNEADGLNLTRANTFPKGFIKIGSSPESVKDNVGTSGWIKYYGTIHIFYYVKEKNNYTINNITYTDEDLVNYMLKNIKDTLLSNKIAGYYLYPDSFGEGGQIVKDREAKIKLYRGVLPVTYYWYECYGI